MQSPLTCRNSLLSIPIYKSLFYATVSTQKKEVKTTSPGSRPSKVATYIYSNLHAACPSFEIEKEPECFFDPFRKYFCCEEISRHPFVDLPQGRIGMDP